MSVPPARLAGMNATFRLDFPVIPEGQARTVHLAIRLSSDRVAPPRSHPAAFCVVLDRSGSMAGRPLGEAKEACRVAVQNLRAGDRFSLVTFDTSAETVIPLEVVGDRTRLLRAIDGISDRGMTNLCGGWMLGRDELAKAPEGVKRQVLLLSDGHLNQGIVDPPAVRQIVCAGLERERIRTSCLGFGADYNEDLMAELARATNGQFHDASTADKLPGIFASELDGLQRLMAHNLRLRLRPLSACGAVVTLGEYPVTALPDGWQEHALGDLMCEEARTVCFGLPVQFTFATAAAMAASEAGLPLVEVELAWDEVTEKSPGLESRTLKRTLSIRTSPNPGDSYLDGEVASAVSLQKAGAVMSEVMRLLDQGECAKALAVTGCAIEALRAYGLHADEAIDQLRRLRRHVEDGGMSARDRKLHRYKSSSFRRMSSSSAWSADESAPSFKKPGKKPGQQAEPEPRPDPTPDPGSGPS